MPHVQAFELWQRWRYWCAEKLRAVIRTRQARHRCSIVIGLMIATVAMLALLLPIRQAVQHHDRDKQGNTTCSLGYPNDSYTFYYQNGSGLFIDDTYWPRNGPHCTQFFPDGSYLACPNLETYTKILEVPASQRLYEQSTNVSGNGTARPVVAVECWFTKIDLAFTTVELTCMTTVWGELADPPSRGRVHLPPNTSLVVIINGAKAMTLNDTATPEVEATSVEVYATGTSSYPDLQLPYQVLVSVFLESTTANTDNGSYPQTVYTPVKGGFTVWLWHSYMPMYQVFNSSCAKVRNREYTIELTGRIELDALSKTLLGVNGFMTWFITVMDFLLTVMLCFSREEAPVGAKTLLSFSATLLFALPTMRAIWPAAPPSSTRMDAMHMFAQLMLISFSVIAQLLYIALWQPTGRDVPESSLLGGLFKATAGCSTSGRHCGDSVARRHRSQGSLQSSPNFEI